jgi:3-oxoacyl-[acyl-carrier-protein] synthase III
VRTPGMFIKGIGAYIPETVGADWAVQRGIWSAEQAAENELTGALVAGDVAAPDMALHAAREALTRSGHGPQDLALLVYTNVWPQGPDGWLPSSYLQRHLTGGDVPAVDLRQGCAGLFGGMQLVTSYLKAQPASTAALLVASDNFSSPLVDRWSSGPFIMGDAASSLVVSKEPGFAELLSVCSTTVLDEEELRHRGKPMFPPSLTLGRGIDMWNRKNTRHQPEVMAKIAARTLKLSAEFLAVVDDTLDEAGITADDISRLALVNGTRELVKDRGMDMLGVDFSRSTWEYGRGVGHCGASDQVLAFNHMMLTGELTPGDHLMMLATGPGIVLSCAVIKILQAPAWAQTTPETVALAS